MSMTGYGRAEEMIGNKRISVEIKSVNHRYLDTNIRVPRRCLFLEDPLRKAIAERVFRGKLDVFLEIEVMEGAEKSVRLNKTAAQNYLSVLSEMSREFSLTNDVTVMGLARFPDVFASEAAAQDEETLRRDVISVLTRALDSFIAMREHEGERMKQDIVSRADALLPVIDEIDRLMPQAVEAYRVKLTQAIRDMIGESLQIDEARIVTEAALYADKIAVAEETVRLRSHVAELHNIMALNEPVGRKLDFLMQEFNREANTIGSKANDLTVAKYVVTLKSEIEKMREQVQNIE